jgi:hypothetical protein
MSARLNEALLNCLDGGDTVTKTSFCVYLLLLIGAQMLVQIAHGQNAPKPPPGLDVGPVSPQRLLDAFEDAGFKPKPRPKRVPKTIDREVLRKRRPSTEADFGQHWKSISSAAEQLRETMHSTKNVPRVEEDFKTRKFSALNAKSFRWRFSVGSIEREYVPLVGQFRFERGTAGEDLRQAIVRFWLEAREIVPGPIGDEELRRDHVPLRLRIGEKETDYISRTAAAKLASGQTIPVVITVDHLTVTPIAAKGFGLDLGECVFIDIYLYDVWLDSPDDPSLRIQKPTPVVQQPKEPETSKPESPKSSEPVKLQMRVWTDSTGKSFWGRLKSRDSGRVKLERPDGEVIEMALDDLRKSDKSYVERQFGR